MRNENSSLFERDSAFDVRVINLQLEPLGSIKSWLEGIESFRQKIRRLWHSLKAVIQIEDVSSLDPEVI